MTLIVAGGFSHGFVIGADRHRHDSSFRPMAPKRKLVHASGGIFGTSGYTESFGTWRLQESLLSFAPDNLESESALQHLASQLSESLVPEVAAGRFGKEDPTCAVLFVSSYCCGEFSFHVSADHRPVIDSLFFGHVSRMRDFDLFSIGKDIDEVLKSGELPRQSLIGTPIELVSEEEARDLILDVLRSTHRRWPLRVGYEVDTEVIDRRPQGPQVSGCACGSGRSFPQCHGASS